MVVIEIRMHVKRRRVHTKYEHGNGQHGDHAAAHEGESMSKATL
jgi:hypothetical protein